MAEPLDLDQYLGKLGLATTPAEHGFLRATASMSGIALKRAQVRSANALEAYGRKRAAAVERYNALVTAGEIRPLTRLEKLETLADGHLDNPSTQAARRLLAKHRQRLEDSHVRSFCKIG